MGGLGFIFYFLFKSRPAKRWYERKLSAADGRGRLFLLCFIPYSSPPIERNKARGH